MWKWIVADGMSLVFNFGNNWHHHHLAQIIKIWLHLPANQLLATCTEEFHSLLARDKLIWLVCLTWLCSICIGCWTCGFTTTPVESDTFHAMSLYALCPIYWINTVKMQYIAVRIFQTPITAVNSDCTDRHLHAHLAPNWAWWFTKNQNLSIYLKRNNHSWYWKSESLNRPMCRWYYLS